MSKKAGGRDCIAEKIRAREHMEEFSNRDTNNSF
jgi:hypothetical protein